MEPYEEAVVEVPEQYVGSVVELFAQRKGEMQDMQPSIEVRVIKVLVRNRIHRHLRATVCTY
jgi:GTP-binding protein